MANIILKISIFIFKILFFIPFLIYTSIFKQTDIEIYEWVHEYNFDAIMDFFSGGFFTFITYSKLMNSGVNIHGIFEAIFFYFGGMASLAWVIFRLKLAILDHKLKSEQLNSVKKDNALKDTMIKDFEKNIEEAIEIKKSILEGK